METIWAMLRFVQRIISPYFEYINQRLYCRQAMKASMKITEEYEEAVQKLNTLQSNAATIQARKARGLATQDHNIPEMHRHLTVLGIRSSDLNKLNIIHISGTKGKGSTSAFCESILRCHGLRTGFFSSPHLVAVRERIRLDGKPLSEHKFTEYFWQVYSTLEKELDKGGVMPAYFKFLTLMAYQVFISECVDVVVMEVGIGGRFDSTNIMTEPIVCGVTSLGIDHVELLGDTYEQIAWQKGGIFKPNVPAVTVSQPGCCMDVLINCAEEVGCGLFQAPTFSQRCLSRDVVPNVSLSGEVQVLNASLAVQLCKIYIDRMRNKHLWTDVTHGPCMLPLVNLTKAYLTGLSECRWPGRNQCLYRPGTTYYLDGAHTSDSVKQAADWFRRTSHAERLSLTESKNVKTALLFNCTGERSVKTLLSRLADLHPDYIIFCPNLLDSSGHRADVAVKQALPSSQLSRLATNVDIWTALSDPHQSSTSQVLTFPCVSSAVSWLSRGQDPKIAPSTESSADCDHIQVFVTGSIHLIGCMFIALKHDDVS